MRRHPTPLLAALLAAAGLATACTREAATPETEARPQAGQAVEEVSSDVQDGWITTKIQAQFFADGDVKARQIDVTTENGVVTLSGVVDDENARQQAVEIAKNTDGVVRVQNRMTSGPVATTGTSATAREAGEEAEGAGRGLGETASNAWITTKIQSQFFADDLVKGRRIDVTTNNGVVTVSGTVASEREKQKALEIARSTEGVRRVEDRLQVAPASAGAAREAAPSDTGAPAGDRELTEQMSDTGITARVQSKFFLDEAVKGRNINVNTAGGVVTLKGEVASEQEKQKALTLARSVDGVKDVRDELQVAPGAAAAESRRTGSPAGGIAAPIEDSWITTKIQSQYFMDDVVKAGQIDVTTENGVVTLSGQVPTSEAKHRAEALAQQTEGVTRVENRLTVGGQETRAPAPPPAP